MHPEYPCTGLQVEFQPSTLETLCLSPRLHRQPPADRHPVGTARVTFVTLPDLSDFQLTLTPGVRITGWDGQANT